MDVELVFSEIRFTKNTWENIRKGNSDRKVERRKVTRCGDLVQQLSFLHVSSDQTHSRCSINVFE